MRNKIFKNKEILLEYSFDSTEQFVAIMDNQMTIKLANKALKDLVDYEDQDFEDVPYWELPIWKNNPALQNQIMFSLELIFHGEDVKFEASYPNKTGEMRDIEFTVKPIIDDNQDVIAITAMGYDVTEAKNAQKQLHFAQDQINKFFDMGVNGYFIRVLEKPMEVELLKSDAQIMIKAIKEEKLLRHNKKLEKIMDFSIDDDESHILFENKYFKLDLTQRQQYFKTMLEDGMVEYTVDFICEAGETRYLHFSIKASVQDGMYLGCYGLVKDVTQEKCYEERLFIMANYDYLTKVPNRGYLLSRVRDLQKEEGLNNCCAAIFDIDFFKSINDNYGHDAGDEVLVEVARAINDIITDKGLFARVGGEEFFAVLNLNLCQSKLLVESILQKIRELRFPQIDENLKLTISSGLTNIKPSDTTDDFYKRADDGLYEAKNSGRNRYVVNLG